MSDDCEKKEQRSALNVCEEKPKPVQPDCAKGAAEPNQDQQADKGEPQKLVGGKPTGAPNFFGMNPKQLLKLAHYMPSVAYYGAASVLVISYVSDWKAVLKYVPFYGGKYKSNDK